MQVFLIRYNHMNKAIEIKRRSDCPISFGLDIFGDKWSLLILRDIMFYNRTRFKDFAPQEHIATNILTDRLNRLEKAGLISKRQDPKLKNQNIYSVTKQGKELLPTLIEMTLWGLQYDPNTLASEDFVQRLKSEKRQLALEVTQAIDENAFLKYRQDEMGIRA
jgi:DNA-binding HxlR family transcriptional regulator